MPEYVYKAVTKQGQIVKNKVEEASKNNLIKKLKHNDLLPIEVVQVSYKSKKARINKRNVIDIDDIMKTANSANVLQGRDATKPSVREKVSLALSAGQKITVRDVMIFTQNFYLLKKAGFNNIHALGTLINSTENLSFRGVLEDILAGVEAGEYMYTTMEYYSNIFPYIYINMIKVGEYICQNGMEVIENRIEPFAWQEGMMYTYPHWLLDIIFYLIFSTFDIFGIYVFAVISGIIIYLLIYYTNLKVTKNNIISGVITLASIYLLKGYITARAQVITYICCILTILFIEQFLETKKKRYIIGLILVPILLANCHAALFPIYFILYLPYIY